MIDHSAIRFSVFELDLETGELRRNGSKIHLQDQPLQILLSLLERPGKVVSRDELQKRLWPSDTFVDFDHGLNAAARRLRDALGDSAENPRFIETVARRGYRFIGQVETGRVEIGAATQTAQRRWPSSVRKAVFGGVVAGLALLALAVVLLRTRSRATPLKITSLAVLPLKNLSGDPAQEYFADGMTEEVIGRLSMIGGLRVIARTSVMRFKDTRTPVREIAEALHVDAIVEGSVMREGSHVRVHAQLIRGSTEEHFWSETYDRQLADILVLESEIARSIASKVETSVTGDERARLTAAHHVTPEVYESYLKGRFVKWNTKAEIEQSITYFEDAIKKDPTFAPAYVGLASGYGSLGSPFVGASPEEVRPKRISALRKALELDPETNEANHMLGEIYEDQWQWAESAAQYKRALALNPNDPGAHLGFAHWLLVQGRTEEAIDWAQRARDLDPLGTGGSEMGWMLFHARRYDEAIRELRSVAAVSPDDAYAHWFLGFALIAKDQSDQAIAPLEKARSLSGGSPAVIGVLVRAYAHAGRGTDARRLLDELKRRQQTGYVPPVAFVNAYLGIGDNEQALVWLERAYQEKATIMQYLKIHPFLDPLRDDPRFANLVHRVGLDQAL